MADVAGRAAVPVRFSAGRILEGAAYLFLFATSLVEILAAMLVVPPLSGGAYAALWAFSREWLWLLGATLLLSISAFIVGPWRVRRRLALWYACATVAYVAVVALTERPELNIRWLLPDKLVAAAGLVALASCSLLPVAWLTRLLPLSRRAIVTS